MSRSFLLFSAIVLRFGSSDTTGSDEGFTEDVPYGETVNTKANDGCDVSYVAIKSDNGAIFTDAANAEDAAAATAELSAVR